MKKIVATLPLLALAAPVRAHEGAHLHPHGIDAVWMALAALAIGGGALWLWKRK